jgi:hypothetical protein
VTAFSAFTPKAAKCAPRLVELPASAFSDSWAEKPDGTLTLGLHTISEQEVTHARSEAARVAWKAHPERDDGDSREDSYRSTLIVCALAAAVCQPEDATLPFWDSQEDMLRMVLTTEAAGHLWQELELLHASESPLSREAGDEEIAVLAARLLSGDAFAGTSRQALARARRLLGCCIDSLPPPPTDPPCPTSE